MIIKWYPGIKINIDPDAVLDFDMDFTTWLEGGAIASVAILPINCTATVLVQTATSVRFRVSAVTGKATVTIRPSTADGQSDDFTTKFNPKSQ